MNTTIQINPTVWNHAMAYANSRGEQLSAIVERLLMSLKVSEPIEKKENAHSYTEGLAGLRGIAKSDMTDKDAVGQYLYAKYGI